MVSAFKDLKIVNLQSSFRYLLSTYHVLGTQYLFGDLCKQNEPWFLLPFRDCP